MGAKALPPLLLLLLFSGCRLYGSYDAADKKIAAMLVANDAFAEELLVSQQDLKTIEPRAATDPAAAQFAQRLQALTLLHETYLVQHREIAARMLDDPPTYRTISRNLGTIITEEALIRESYKQLFFSESQEADTSSVVSTASLPDVRYTTVPPFYERLLTASRLTAATERQRAREEEERQEPFAPDSLAAPAATSRPVI